LRGCRIDFTHTGLRGSGGALDEGDSLMNEVEDNFVRRACRLKVMLETVGLEPVGMLPLLGLLKCYLSPGFGIAQAGLDSTTPTTLRSILIRQYREAAANVAPDSGVRLECDQFKDLAVTVPLFLDGSCFIRLLHNALKGVFLRP
jgi:hypothetical protein